MKNIKLSDLPSNYVYLKSVGTLIDIKTANLYPVHKDNTISWSSECNLNDDEISQDWFDALNKIDTIVIKNENL